MGLIYSCGTEITERDRQQVGNCARQLGIRHKFLASKRAELVIQLSTMKHRKASRAELVSVLGRLKSLDAQIQKIVGCHAMFESMKEATDTTNLLASVRTHLKTATSGDEAVPDPDSIYDIQDSLEIASDALRETNAALGAEWTLEAYTPNQETLEAELQRYLSPGNQDHPSGPDSQSSSVMCQQPSEASKKNGQAEMRTSEETPPTTETEERPFVAPSVPATSPISTAPEPSSTLPNTDSRQPPRLSQLPS